MSAQTIYDELRRAGMTHEGACAMLGNMRCESGLKANIAQRGMTSLTDAQYTKLFDTNPERCISDGVGYGLCQWTYPQRKRNLRQFARNWGVSVGAEDMQTAFAVDELRTEYKAMWKYLCETDELYTATERICKEYERPAVNNVDERYEAAQEFSAKLAAIGATDTSPDTTNTAIELIEDIADKLSELKILILSEGKNEN